jgi:hypothetical protein
MGKMGRAGKMGKNLKSERQRKIEIENKSE